VLRTNEIKKKKKHEQHKKDKPRVLVKNFTRSALWVLGKIVAVTGLQS